MIIVVIIMVIRILSITSSIMILIFFKRGLVFSDF